MGNKQGKRGGAKPNSANNDDDDDDDEGATVENEAEPFIHVTIIKWSSKDCKSTHVCSVNPNIKVKVFKQELSRLLTIPHKNIQIFRSEDCKFTAEMPDNLELTHWYVKDGTQLAIRDRTIKY